MDAQEASAAAAGASAEVEMELDLSGRGSVPSFEFPFNSPNFSDRVLRIEIVASENLAGSSGDIGGGSIADLLEEKGNKGQSVDSSVMMLVTPVLREKTICINSAILASGSPFFLKLLSNGMEEPHQTHPTFRISDSEENALMELISYMCSGKLTTAEPALLLDILMAAEKFEVPSCMRHCSQILTSLPMTTESALLYIDHPCSTSSAAEVQRAMGVAKEFLANKYRDFDMFQHEVMNISLAGIEAIFSSNGIRVETEDDIYFFMLKWARARYLKLDERRKILSSRLLPLVHFCHMTFTTLQGILTCTDKDIDHEDVTKRVTEVLLQQGYQTQLECSIAADTEAYRQFLGQNCEYKPVKVIAFDEPYPQVTVYLDLKREECSPLFPSGDICLHRFRLAGWGFYLNASCEMDEHSKLYRFGLWLGTSENLKGSRCLTVDYEFAARTRPSRKFMSKLMDKVTFTIDRMKVCYDLFDVPWSTFIADDSLFIDGVLRLRVDLMVMEQPKLQPRLYLT